MGERLFPLKRTQDNGLGLRALSNRMEFGTKHCFRFLFSGRDIHFQCGTKFFQRKKRNLIPYVQSSKESTVSITKLHPKTGTGIVTDFLLFFSFLSFLQLYYECYQHRAENCSTV